jgi:hypothetical protein
VGLHGYYSQVRPHEHNAGLSPNVAEKDYWAEYKTVAKKLDHYSLGVQRFERRPEAGLEDG